MGYGYVIEPIYPDFEEEVEVYPLYTYSGGASGTAAIRTSTPDYRIAYFAFDLTMLDFLDEGEVTVSGYPTAMDNCTGTIKTTTDPPAL